MNTRLTETGRKQVEQAAGQLLRKPRKGHQYDLTTEEQDAVDALSENGWSLLGVGSTRVVVRPPDDAIVDPYTGSSYVVKLARSAEPDALPTARGTGQNRAEWRVYNRLAEEDVRGADIDWFAQVYETGSTTIPDDIGGTHVRNAWLTMEYLPPLVDVYSDAPSSVLEDIASRFFTGTHGRVPFSVDAGVDNIGMRVWDASDAPDMEDEWSPADWCAFIDYGIVNWDGWEPSRP